jgi:hypothetical protein
VGRYCGTADQTGDKARAGEVVRLLADRHREHPGVRLLGARMKLVGGDSGRLEHESLIVQALLAPSERRRRSTVRYQ